MQAPLAIALSASLFLGLFLLAGSARGDEPPSPPAVPPLPAASAPAPASSPTSPSCRLGAHEGIEEADAQTSARLVCSEIIRAGGASGASFRVDLGQLGSLVILTVTREADAGGTPDVRDVRLHQIEAVASAAPRLAAAIVHGTALEDAPTTPPAERASSSTKMRFGLGIVGQLPPLDRSLSPVPGVDLELSSDIDPIVMVGSFRVGANSGKQSVAMAFVAFSVGARYFLGHADTSAYLGGGFAWSYYNMVDNANTYFNGNHSGLGAYGEVGLEFLHTRHANVAIGARVDAPFFSLTSDSIVDVVTTSANGTQTTQEYLPSPIYYVPLSFELRITF
jgi:hypothetical protein